MKYFLSIAIAIAVSSLILFLSIVRATLPNALEKISQNEYRSILLALKPVYADENISNIIGTDYNLPQPGMLPNNPFYGFKYMRDWIWLKLTTDPASKSKLLQHNADKKMSETVALIAESKTKEAYISMDEAYKYLQETRQVIGKIPKEQKDRASQQKLQLMRAGIAYLNIVNGFTTSVTSSEYDKKTEWLQILAEWNESLAKEEED